MGSEPWWPTKAHFPFQTNQLWYEEVPSTIVLGYCFLVLWEHVYLHQYFQLQIQGERVLFIYLFFSFLSLHLIYQLFKSIFTSHNRSFKICSFLFSLLFWFPNFCAFINFHGANASWASTYFISQNCL